MTDLAAKNADIQQRRPGSTAVFTTLDVRIHATPPVDRAGDKARLVKLQHAPAPTSTTPCMLPPRTSRIKAPRLLTAPRTAARLSAATR
jgi:hypothetical protein